MCLQQMASHQTSVHCACIFFVKKLGGVTRGGHRRMPPPPNTPPISRLFALFGPSLDWTTTTIFDSHFGRQLRYFVLCTLKSNFLPSTFYWQLMPGPPIKTSQSSQYVTCDSKWQPCATAVITRGWCHIEEGHTADSNEKHVYKKQAALKAREI